LAIETSGTVPTIALWDGSLVGTAKVEGAQRVATGLLPTMDRLLRSHGVTLNSLTKLAVGLGPGSFTGLRIGVTIARSLAHALDLPLVGVSSLEALAHRCIGALEPPAPEHVCAAVRSKRDEVYVARFDVVTCEATPELRLVPPIAPVALDDLPLFARDLPTPSLLVGQEWADCADRPGLLLYSADDTPCARAEDIARLASRRAGEKPQDIVPIYVRRSQAEHMMGEGPEPWRPAGERSEEARS